MTVVMSSDDFSHFQFKNLSMVINDVLYVVVHACNCVTMQ